MAGNKQRRSSGDGVTETNQAAVRVGARHKDPFRQPQGGRYQDICTVFETSEKKSLDPRLDELKDMGLGIFWRQLAERIGYDEFMLVWAALSDQASEGDNGHRVYIPRFDSYMRFQRNRYIVALASSGSKTKEIRHRVQEDLNETVHEMHISKVIRQKS